MRKNNNITIKNTLIYNRLILMCIIYAFNCVLIYVYASKCNNLNSIKFINEESDNRYSNLYNIQKPQKNNNNNVIDDLTRNSKSEEIIKEITFLSRNELLIIFNFNVNAEKAVFLSADLDYPVSHFSQISPNTVIMVYEKEFPLTGIHTISYYYLLDEMGEAYWGFYNVTLNFSEKADVVKFGDIVFSEIMANPKNAPTLPDVEYIEFYNRSQRDISLKGWKYFYNYKSYSLPDITIRSGEYLAFCNAAKTDQFEEGINMFPITSFPAMNNTGKLIYVEDNNEALIHFVEYSNKWYYDKNKAAGGYSLEAIDIDNIYPSSENWIASCSTSGGTPGSANCVNSNNPDNERAFLISHFKSDETLKIRFSKNLYPEKYLLQKIEAVDVLLSEFSFINYPYTDYIELTYNGIAQDDDLQPFVLKVDSLKCLSFNPVFSPGELEFEYPDSPKTGDIKFSEILFNAENQNHRFIELCNRSNKFFDIKDITLIYSDNNEDYSTEITLSEHNSLLEPGKYLLISKNPDIIFEKYGYHGAPRISKPSVFPSLNTKKGYLKILNSKKQVIDSLFYSESLHSVPAKKCIDVSLERISFNIDSNTSTNWCSGSENSDFASPGYANILSNMHLSVDSEYEKHDPFYSLYPYMKIREGYPQSEIAVKYSLENNDGYIDMIVFDSKGVEIGKPYSDYNITGEGILIVDLLESSNRKVVPGIYIVFVRCKTDNKIIEKKITIPVVP